jgi:predicted DNA-binding ribbon-helix-helix protein
MNSTVKRRSIVIDSHKTSISLEDSFWTSLRQIARQRATTVSEVVRTLKASREGGNLRDSPECNSNRSKPSSRIRFSLGALVR